MYAGSGSYLHSLASNVTRFASGAADSLSSTNKLRKQEQLISTRHCALQQTLELIFNELIPRANRVKTVRQQQELYRYLVEVDFLNFPRFVLERAESRLQKLRSDPEPSDEEEKEFGEDFEKKKDMYKRWVHPVHWDLYNDPKNHGTAYRSEVAAFQERVVEYSCPANRCKRLFCQYLAGDIEPPTFIEQMFKEVDVAFNCYKRIQNGRWKYEEYFDSFSDRFRDIKISADNTLSNLIIRERRKLRENIEAVAGSILKKDMIKIENLKLSRWGADLTLNLTGGFSPARREGCNFRIMLNFGKILFRGECKFTHDPKKKKLELAELIIGELERVFDDNGTSEFIIKNQDKMTFVERIVYALAAELLERMGEGYFLQVATNAFRLDAHVSMISKHGFERPRGGIIHDEIPYSWTLTYSRARAFNRQFKNLILPEAVTDIF